MLKPKLVLLLADPFTTPMDMVLTAFNDFYPALPLIGGIASGSTRAGGNALLFNERLLNHGAVGVTLAGNLDVDIIVSQGCRPIGQPLMVTNAWQNLIYTLEGEPPLVHLQKLFQELPAKDRDLLQNGLYLGRAISPSEEILGRGDFLVRGVMGIDQRSGAMVVSDYIDANEMVQFHLRDASTAAEDLEMMLAPQLFYDPPSGGLLFSCNGRGTRLYSHPNGDIRTIQKVVGEINLAGFFCAGEIGPIGGKNFLHGQTASLALFRPQVEDN
jgi:small ligand-binding sensory domain FIST